jgi:hypothetical protein
VEEAGTRTESDEKLRIIGILCAVVRAGDETSVGEPQSWVYLVLERFCRAEERVRSGIQNGADERVRASIDGLATTPCAGPIAGLNEEVWDDPVSADGRRINLGR